jgi:hypothetical protein
LADSYAPSQGEARFNKAALQEKQGMLTWAVQSVLNNNTP